MKFVIGFANFLNNYGINKKKISLSQLKEIIQFAKKKNIFEIDTSDVYKKNYQNNFHFLKKININKKINFDKKKIYNDRYIYSLIKREHIFLSKIKQKKYHSVLVHNFYQFNKLSDQLRLNQIMTLFQKSGLTKNIGISIYEKKELKYLHRFCNYSVIQLPLNLLNKTFDINMLKLLKKKNYTVYVRSIFLQGLLLKKFKDLEKKFQKFIVLKKIDNWLNKNRYNRLNIIIHDLKKYKKYIDKVVIGVDNLNQLKEIIKIKNRRKFFQPYYFRSKSKNLIDPRSW
jgi:diketogulonate reductase-like aldo/keto reductase